MRVRLGAVLVAFLLVLACATHAHAAGDIYARYNGSCEQGGNKVKTNGIQSSNMWQQSFPACTVTVLIHTTQLPATIYATADGTVPLANPFTATSHGVAAFYATNGVYDVQYSGAGIITPFTIPQVELCFNCTGTGGGGVASVSSSNLLPLFNVSVATPTTTPLFQFNAPAAAANQVYGNCTPTSSIPNFCGITVPMLPFTYSGNTTDLATVGNPFTGVGALTCLDANGNLTTAGCIGGGGSGGPNYHAAFTSQTTVTILGTAHQLGNANLLLQCYDNATVPNAIEPATWTVNPSTYDVIITFASAQSGYCALNGSSGGSGGGGTTNPGGVPFQLQFNNTTFGGAQGTAVTQGSGIGPASVCIDVENNVVNVCPDLNFNVTPASPSTLSSGANTITFTNCPVGVNGTDTVAALNPHYLLINSAGGDTAPTEPVLITGGTCVSGSASGTITFSAAFAHTAGYTIGSATTGIQEGVQLTGANPNAVIDLLPKGNYSCFAPIFLARSNLTFDGGWNRIKDQSFESCIVMGNRPMWGESGGNLSQDLKNFDINPDVAFWSVQPTGSIAGGSATATLTIPTCPAGFYGAIPNQILWVAGTASGLPTTPFGYGEYVLTQTGGTCTPGATSGTINILAIQGGNLSAHDNTYSISNNVAPAIEDSLVNGGHIHDTRIISGDAGAVGSYVMVDNDQSFSIDSVNLDAGNPGRIDSDFQAAAIYSIGPFAINAGIAYISKANISGWASCVRWYDDNDLTISDSICQNYITGGVVVGYKRGGFGAFTVGPNVHFENGSIVAPWGTPLGNPEVLIMGDTVPVNVETEYLNAGGIFSTSNSAPWPIYQNRVGEAAQYYYLVAHNNTLTSRATCNSGGDCVTAPTLMGVAYTNDPSANNVTVNWYGWGSGIVSAPTAEPSSYDILRIQGVGTAYPIPPIATAALAVATNVSIASHCDIHNHCSFVDNVAPASLASYTPIYLQTSTKRYYPAVQLLPGNVSIVGVGAAGVTPEGSYRGYPACINAMEFFGKAFVAALTSTAVSVNNQSIESCPYSLAPISAAGSGTTCMSAGGTCGGAGTGTVEIAASATTVTVSTTDVQLWSKFKVQEDMNALTGTLLGNTCNSTGGRTYWVSNVVPGVSFQINASAAPSANPACIDWQIVNN